MIRPLDDSFLRVSRKLLDRLGPEGIGDEHDVRDYLVDGVEPRWVLFPANEQECAATLGILSEERLTIVPAGLGARLSQGNRPPAVDAVLSLRRMDRIVDHAAADMTLTVEAGATIAGIDERVRGAGQWLGIDPPFAARTTIGGLLATQVTGPARHRFGTVRDSLLGVRALLADGTAVKSGGRVVKNVAGYDVQKLLVGSFGTLAVIVEASFKLRPTHESEIVVAFSAKRIQPLLRLAVGVATSNLDPLCLELFASPGRYPTLAVGLAGFAEEVMAADRSLRILAAQLAVENVSGLSRLEVASEVERIAAVGSETDGVAVLRAGVPPSRLEEWILAALETLPAIGSATSVHAHAGAGVARVRIEGTDPRRLAPALAHLRAIADGTHGYVVVESVPASWKPEIESWGTPPGGFSLMRGIKHAFDPLGLLSPARFVGGI